jgi:ribonuclease-3
LSTVDSARDVAALLELLGLPFDDVGLVEQAMSHRSWCAENPGHESYERLEFLGDAVLGWVTADVAFRRFPQMSEGQLTGIRKGVVNTSALAALGAELGIGPYIKLGKGEAAAHGSRKPSILADAMEALIGAIYIDRGPATAHAFVESLIADRIEATAERLDELDFKTTLQELLAAAGMDPPVYDISEKGPDHETRFFATVWVGGGVLGTGEGRSKRAAEQDAAAAATRRFATEVGGAPAGAEAADRGRGARS